jgi:DNA-binding GntR family transcriptional regulator
MERTVLSDQVYDTLFQAILSGKIGPGEHLVEQALANRLNVSRISVRSAIQQLAKDGLVDLQPNRGAFIVSFSPEDIEEIFSLRAALESMAIRRSTQYAGPGDLLLLEETVELMKELVDLEQRDDRLIWASLDTQFHQTLMELSRHKRAIRVWRSMSAQISLVVFNVSNFYPRYDSLAAIHQEIVDVIRSGDQEKAAELITFHILESRQFLLEAVTLLSRE